MTTPRSVALASPTWRITVPFWNAASSHRRPELGVIRARRSALVVLVVAAPPDARLVTPLGGAVEPLVHAPETVHSARIGGVGVVDSAVLERERAQARPLARVRGLVGPGHGCEGGRSLAAGLAPPRALAPVVLFDARALLVLGEPDGEVGVEVAAERRGPGERPAQPPLVGLQLREGRPRHGPEHDIMIGQ